MTWARPWADEARMKLEAAGSPAERVVRFDHHHLAPGPGEERGGGQAVVAAADDDGIK